MGVGGSDSVSQPMLLESIQHVCIKQVSVNSGGKHCLALSAEGEVFSWGEGDDGKLGHGSKASTDRPRIVEALRGREVVLVSCGGAHSAAVTATGKFVFMKYQTLRVSVKHFLFLRRVVHVGQGSLRPSRPRRF